MMKDPHVPVEKPTKPATIKDVARVAGVSFKTVSRVLNNNPSVNPLLKEAVNAAIKQLDYRQNHAARALRSARSYALALLTGWGPEMPKTSTPPAGWAPKISEYLSELTMGCGIAAREAGYHLIYDFLSLDNPAQARHDIEGLIRNLKPDGVLLVPPLSDLPWLLDLLDAHGTRYARLVPGTALERGLNFTIDDFSAAKQVAELLLDQGHRHIGMITGHPRHLAAQERRRGFEAALAQTPGATGGFAQGDFTTESGLRAGLELLEQSPRPTAIFAANDTMAAGVMRAAMQLGLTIPQDLSLVGFDDSLIAQMANPPLTTIRQPTFEMAMRATAMLAQLADQQLKTPNKNVNLAFSLTLRDSTGPAPAAPGTGF